MIPKRYLSKLKQLHKTVYIIYIFYHSDWDIKRMQPLRYAFLKRTSMTLIFSLLLFVGIPMVQGSPMFDPQVVTGSPDDQQDRDNQIIQGRGYTDIMTVTYHSDGNNLNATFWLNGALEENPSTSPVFMILIDADFDESSGINGIDYGSKIYFENGMWKKELLEWSQTGSKTFERIVNSQEITPKEIFTDGQDYVSHSLELEKIGSPTNYRLIFSTFDKIQSDDNNIYKEVFDYSDWIIIPNPSFSFQQIPEVITLRQGQTKEVQIMINPSPLSVYDVYLIDESNKHGLVLTYDEKKFTLDPFEVTEITISAKDDAKVGLKPIKINAQITPKTDLNSADSQSQIEKSGIENEQTSRLDIIGIGDEQPQSKQDTSILFSIGKITIPHRTHVFFVMVEVLPALTTGEQIKEILDPWQSPVNLFTIIASAGGAAILWLWQHRHKTKSRQSTLV